MTGPRPGVPGPGRAHLPRGAATGPRGWHPVTVAGGIAAAGSTVAAAAVCAALAGRPVPSAPVIGPVAVLGAWLLAGAAAGFATSGST